jgi:hypothetical protein
MEMKPLVWRNLRACILKSSPEFQFMRVRNSDGVMTVVSNLTPCPWPSRFSKDVHTVVRIPPETN